MALVLTIEDDAATGKEIVAQLTKRGFSVEWTTDGEEGLKRALTGAYDVITLDRMLPSQDGLTVVRRLREAGIDTPVLMLSALNEVDERIDGLRAGGDDYLTKPFNPDEMAMRVEVLLRRKRGDSSTTVLKVGDLELNLVARIVTRAGQEVRLHGTEFKLLEYLMRNTGQTVTRRMIFEDVWGYNFDPGANLINVHVGQLRRKIDRPGRDFPIHTVRGSGYRLDAVS